MLDPADQGLLPCVRIPCTSKDNKRRKTMVRFKREDVLAFIKKYYRN
jgi:hypothetical protein